MPPATLTTPDRHRTASPPHAAVAGAETTAPHPYDGAVADPAAVHAARDAVARYLGDLGLAVNSRPARTATAACLDAAFGEVGPQASPAELARVALRHAALGMSRWLNDLSDRGPTPPRFASLAAKLSAGRATAVPEDRPRKMTPQRFGR